MPQHGNLDFLLAAEVLVVVHLSRHEGVRALGDGLVEQEVARPSADDDLAHRALQQIIVHQALHMEHGLHPLQELQRVLRFRKRTHHSASCHDGIFASAVLHLHRMGLQQPHLFQVQLLGDFEVHPVLGVVQVRVGRIDDDVVQDGLAHATLRKVAVRNGLQPAEQQRMVRHHEVASQRHRLVYHFFRHVQTQ